MKQKGILIAYIIAIVLLSHAILVVGCGKNPLLGAMGSSISVGVGNISIASGSQNASSTVFRAHNSASGLESFTITVTSIRVTKEGGISAVVWKGSQEVDLAKATSLTSFKGDIAPGEYKYFTLGCSTFPKVKGSIVVAGKTYYTKTNHTNYETPPAELEEICPLNSKDETETSAQEEQYRYKFGFSTGLASPIQIGGASSASVSEIYALVDTSYILIYYDGNKDTGNGYEPYNNNTGTGKTAGMYLNEIPFALTFGIPAKKEVYHYTVSSSTNPYFSPSGTGRFTILFDASDNLVGSSAKQLLIDNTGNNFSLYGSLVDQSQPGYGEGIMLGFDPDSFKKNADGTYTVRMMTGIGASVTKIYLTNFQRSSHTGNFTYRNGQNGESVTGTYAATRIE